MRQRRRRNYAPSTGRKLVLLVTDEAGQRRFSGALLSERVDGQRDQVTRLAGDDRSDWAIAPLKEIPEYVKPGWPNPCKAARMSMGGKSPQRHGPAAGDPDGKTVQR